jgi:hypothetical protein
MAITPKEQRAFEAMVSAGLAEPDDDPEQLFASLRSAKRSEAKDAGRLVSQKVRSHRENEREVSPLLFSRSCVAQKLEFIFHGQNLRPSCAISERAIERIEGNQTPDYPTGLALARLFNLPPDAFSPFSFRWVNGQYVDVEDDRI